MNELTTEYWNSYAIWNSFIYMTEFWKTDHPRTRTEINLCLYMIDTLMHYPETPSNR